MLEYCPHGALLDYDDCGVCTPSQSDKSDDALDLTRLAREKGKDPNNCACGCGLPHNTAISSSFTKPNGYRGIFWYRTTKCQFNHAAARRALAAQ